MRPASRTRGETRFLRSLAWDRATSRSSSRIPSARPGPGAARSSSFPRASEHVRRGPPPGFPDLFRCAGARTRKGPVGLGKTRSIGWPTLGLARLPGALECCDDRVGIEGGIALRLRLIGEKLPESPDRLALASQGG